MYSLVVVNINYSYFGPKPPCVAETPEYKYEILNALPDAIEDAQAAASRDHSATVPEWNNMSESQKVCWFMNPAECRYLQGKKAGMQRKHIAMKAAFESCGVKIPDRKRYKHSFAPCTDSDAEDLDDDIAVD